MRAVVAIEVRFELVKADMAGVLVLRSTPEATSTRVDDKDYGGTRVRSALWYGRRAGSA